MTKQRKTLTLKVEGGSLVFGHGARGKAIVRNGWSSRTATIQFADGTKHAGMVEICDQDSGEHYGTGVYLPAENDITFQDDKDFLQRLGRNAAQVYPYRYKYHGTIARDHHVGRDGWS